MLYITLRWFEIIIWQRLLCDACHFSGQRLCIRRISHWYGWTEAVMRRMSHLCRWTDVALVSLDTGYIYYISILLVDGTTPSCAGYWIDGNAHILCRLIWCMVVLTSCTGCLMEGCNSHLVQAYLMYGNTDILHMLFDGGL